MSGAPPTIVVAGIGGQAKVVLEACRAAGCAVVGAGAVVIRDVADEAAVIGSPARIVR
jgi:serine acetyltransferase